MKPFTGSNNFSCDRFNPSKQAVAGSAVISGTGKMSVSDDPPPTFNNEHRCRDLQCRCAITRRLISPLLFRHGPALAPSLFSIAEHNSKCELIPDGSSRYRFRMNLITAPSIFGSLSRIERSPQLPPACMVRSHCHRWAAVYAAHCLTATH